MNSPSKANFRLLFHKGWFRIQMTKIAFRLSLRTHTRITFPQSFCIMVEYSTGFQKEKRHSFPTSLQNASTEDTKAKMKISMLNINATIIPSSLLPMIWRKKDSNSKNISGSLPQNCNSEWSGALHCTTEHYTTHLQDIFRRDLLIIKAQNHTFSVTREPTKPILTEDTWHDSVFMIWSKTHSWHVESGEVNGSYTNTDKSKLSLMMMERWHTLAIMHT